MRPAAPLRTAAVAALAGALSLGAGTAQAHLLPAQRGTVNVVGTGVFVVLSVPAASLHGADDDGNGVLDMAELERHEAELRAEIDRRVSILDGSTPATTVRVDMMLSPQHDAAGDRADQILVLKHAQLDAPPTDLRMRCDLFGPRAPERSLTITATRHPVSGTETEIGVLTPDAPDHAFFAVVPPAPPPARAPRSLLALSALSALALVTWSRGRKSVKPTP